MKDKCISQRFFDAFDNFSLRKKLILISIITTAIPLIIILSTYMHAIYSNILRTSSRDTNELLKQVNYNLDTRLETVDTVSASLIINGDLKIALQSDFDRFQRQPKITSILSKTVISAQDIDHIVLFTPDGSSYCDTGYIAKDFVFSESPYDLKGEWDGNSVWIGKKKNIVYDPLQERYVFPSISLIKDYATNQLLGTVSINLSTRIFDDLLSTVYFQRDNILFLINEDRNLLSSSSNIDLLEYNGSYFPSVKLSGNAGSYVENTPNGKAQISYLKNQRTGWYIVSFVPSSEILLQLNTFTLITLILIFICVGITLFLSWFFSKKISNDFSCLLDMTIELGSENKTVKDMAQRTDEVGKLYLKFQNMLQRNEEQQRRENLAHLKAHQAQIAPHFLYNTLDCINWMLLEKEEYNISSIIVALSDLLRYSISNKDNCCTVAMEMEQIENYLLIQKMRFPKKIEYTLNIPEELQGQSILKLSLQPLVENAFVHGLENSPKSGILKITCFRDEQELVFKIADNGIGIPKEKLLQLDKQLNSPDNLYSEHHGIINVHQRIRLTYGNHYRLSIESKPDAGTTVTVIFPYNE